MNTLIVYGTKHGSTEKCANILAERLQGKTKIQNLKNADDIDLTQYDNIIIGGSIYVGKIQKEVRAFCTKNIEMLKTKKTGLYICGLQSEILQEELSNSFPGELLENSIAKECFGGEMIFKKMNFIEKVMIKTVAKIDKDILNISDEVIDSFVKQMSTAS